MWPLGRQREELFLLLSLTPRETRGWLVGVDAKKGALAVRRRLRPFAGMLDSAYRAPAELRLAARLASGIIVGAEPSLAATAVVPVSLPRERVGEPLTADELQELVGRALGEAMSRARDSAARELGTPEVDTLLMKGRMGDFRLDGHRVGNPLGFASRVIEATLVFTFAARPLFSTIRRLPHSRSTLAFAETASAEMACLDGTPRAPKTLIYLGEDGSVLCRSGEQGLLRDVLPWGTSAFPQAISIAWGIPLPSARAAYRRYLAGGHSSAVRKHLAKLFAPAEEALLVFLREKNVSGRAVLEGGDLLPFRAPFRKGGTAFEPAPPPSAFLEREGFSCEELSLAELAPLLEHRFGRGVREVNEWLAHRLHWLGSPMT